MEGISYEQGRYGLRAVVISPWRDEMKQSLVQRTISELELNQGKGWQGDDLSFLDSFPGLKSLEILDGNLSRGMLAPIHFLHELVSLTVHTFCKSEIDFGAFPKLEVCKLDWRPNAVSIFSCLSLKSLLVVSYKGADFGPFSKLKNLQSLSIFGAPFKSLAGIGLLQKLRILKLARMRGLESLEGLPSLKNLEELEIECCRKIRSLDPLTNLLKLKKLDFSDNGNIDSIKPLTKLINLEWLSFTEATNVVDGDMSPLLSLPNLKRLSYMNRRHYTNRREEFRAYWGK